MECDWMQLRVCVSVHVHDREILWGAAARGGRVAHLAPATDGHNHLLSTRSTRITHTPAPASLIHAEVFTHTLINAQRNMHAHTHTHTIVK